MDANILRFLHQFRTGKIDFDVGVNGRKILHVGELVLIDEKKSKIFKPARHNIQIAICNDVVLVCKVTGAADSICELMVQPMERSSVLIESIILFDDREKNLMKISYGRNLSYVVEARNTAEKAIWMQLLQDRTTFVATADLHGPRLVPLARMTRDDVINWQAIPNPFTQEGQEILEKEWKSIPKVCILY